MKMLAAARNRVLRTLYESSSSTFAHVAFLNDVAFCAKDVLELLHQQVSQQADMTCGMDLFTYGSKLQRL